jgi:hypothetical protein
MFQVLQIPHRYLDILILIIKEGGICLEFIASVKDGCLHLGICDSAASMHLGFPLSKPYNTG